MGIWVPLEQKHGFKSKSCTRSGCALSALARPNVSMAGGANSKLPNRPVYLHGSHLRNSLYPTFLIGKVNCKPEASTLKVMGKINTLVSANNPFLLQEKYIY